MIKGEVSTPQGGSFTKMVGSFEGKIIAINPTLEDLKDLVPWEPKEPDYLTEDREGNDGIYLEFWVKDVDSDYTSHFRILLSKTLDKTSTGKQFYINEQGVSFCVDEEENLPDWFSDFKYWKAYQGERNLYSLLKAWTQVRTYDDPDATMYIDRDKLLQGNVKELRELLGGDYDNSILFNTTIGNSTKENDQGEFITKYYDNLFYYKFVPGARISMIRTDWKKIMNKVASEAEVIRYGIIDGYYKDFSDWCRGVIHARGFSTLEPLRPFDEEKEGVIESNDPVLEQDSSEY